MDIEFTDKTGKFKYSSNENILHNNNNSDNNNNISSKIVIEEEKNIFPKNKKSIYGQNQLNIKKISSSGELTLCEGRLLNDLAEFKRSKIVGKLCQIKLYDYKKNFENDCFELIVEFISYFSVKFIFEADYPCSPPIIVYYRGTKIANIFDENGNVLIESIKRANWTPSIWLSTLIYSIELLISSGENYCKLDYNNNFNTYNQGINNYFMMAKNQKYGKRKWSAYINECNEYYSKECSFIPELEKNLKHLKIK